MLHKIATASGMIALLMVSSVSAQRVPVAEGAIADHEWPTVDEIGVPLYPDLKAYMAAVSPANPFAQNASEFRFVNFASQADVPTLLAWYEEHADGWVVDADMRMLFPEGVDANAAMTGQSPFVNFFDMTEAPGKCLGISCKSTVQVVYKPGG